MLLRSLIVFLALLTALFSFADYVNLRQFRFTKNDKTYLHEYIGLVKYFSHDKRAAHDPSRRYSCTFNHYSQAKESDYRKFNPEVQSSKTFKTYHTMPRFKCSPKNYKSTGNYLLDFESCRKKEGAEPSWSFEIHDPSKRNSDTAIILLHGITDSSWVMAYHGSRLFQKTGARIYGVTYSGHGTRMDQLGGDTFDLSLVRADMWINDLYEAIRQARQAGAKKVVLAGLSTGAMLALYAATNHCWKSNIDGVVLMSVPINSKVFIGKVAAGKLLCLSPDLLPNKWVSQVEYKEPSQFRYQSPNKGGLCALDELMDKVHEAVESYKDYHFEGPIPAEVPVLYLGAEDDNLIDHKKGVEQMEKHFMARRHPSLKKDWWHIYKKGGHAGLLFPELAMTPSHQRLKNVQPDLVSSNAKDANNRIIRFLSNSIWKN